VVQPVKFAFATRFEAPPGSQGRAELFDRQQVEQIRAEVWEAAFKEGAQRERASTERKESEALAALAQALKLAAQANQAAENAACALAARLALGIARKLAGALLERAPEAEIESFVGSCLARLMGEPRAVVRLPAALFDRVASRIDQVAAQSGFAGRVVLVGDEALKGADCRVEWADGGAERACDEVWSDIDALVARLTADPATDNATITTSGDAR